MRVYDSLDEAVEDVGYSHNRKDNNYSFTGLGSSGSGDKIRNMEFEGVVTGFDSKLETREIGDFLREVLRTTYEMIDNVYVHFVRGDLERSFIFERWIGDRGLLIGTGQLSDFFTEEQAALLRAGKPVPSLDSSGGMGTQIIVSQSHGLFVDIDKSSIYASFLYPKA